MESTNQNGWMYILKAIGVPYVKIGFSAGNFKSRFSSIQTGCPFKCDLIVAVEASMEEEKEVHSILADWRAQGEWFFDNAKEVRRFIKLSYEGIAPIRAAHAALVESTW